MTPEFTLTRRPCCCQGKGGRTPQGPRMRTQFSFLLSLPLLSVAAFSNVRPPLQLHPNCQAAIQLPSRAWAHTATVRVLAVSSGAPLSASSCGVGVCVRKERGPDDGHGVVPQLLAAKGGGQKVAQGADDDLPSPLALFKHLFGEVLQSPQVRGLFVLDVCLHVLSAAVAISLGWLRFVFPALMAVTFKVYFAWLLVLVVVLTEVCSAFINGAIISRLAGGGKGESVISTKVGGLLVLAVTSAFVRIVLVAFNQIFPLFGTILVPQVLKRVSSKRKHVYWVEQMDMVLTVMINENLGFTQGRGRAIEYYLSKWGSLPVRSVRVDGVFGKAALLLILGVALPLIVYGRSQHLRLLVAVGYSIFVSVFTALQCLRPLAANVYATAAYRYTELGRNDVWTRFPALAPRAYRSTDTVDPGNDKSK